MLPIEGFRVEEKGTANLANPANLEDGQIGELGIFNS